ncbi:MAG: hypothetical protein WCE23_16565 [Candidatus Binatus sp.]|uniref:hypothetical protein n=1 Tax=Candidatus Binatus sp. TaxID=2811406 RepID=UPI003C714E60
MMRKGFFAVAAMTLLLSAAQVFAFTNPAALTTGVFTPIAASSTAVSVNSSLSQPRFVEHLEIQNQCASAVTIQFQGATAVFGQGYLLAAGATKVFDVHESIVPGGPYSFITASATCSPDTQTGLVILELP